MQNETNSIEELASLEKRMSQLTSLQEKNRLLFEFSKTTTFFQHHPEAIDKISFYSEKERYILLLLIALGQGEILFEMHKRETQSRENEENFFSSLEKIDNFYQPMGGILGYHLQFLKLLQGKDQKENVQYDTPYGIDLTNQTEQVRNYVLNGISALKDIAEIYPIGGAGERLGLRHPRTGKPLPVACLEFCGRTLLQELVRDLQAKEYLYFKVFHEQITTPIAMMTSLENENDQQIQTLCEESEWFHRPKESFYFFVQPGSPVITKEGIWSFEEPFKLHTKPGGHGVLWILCQEKGVFDWFTKMGRHKVFVRQINNPQAGTDSGLLGFLGVGFLENKAFGFASCQRKVEASEGMVVLMKKNKGELKECCISNVEYTEFAKKGIEDVPKEQGGCYSAYPANTNLLYGDIKSIESALKKIPFPGKILNMKTKVPYFDAPFEKKEIQGGRLECLMQDIAEGITDFLKEPIHQEAQTLLRTYVTFYDREKTIAVTKKHRKEGESILETPEGCFYEIQKNMYRLFSEYCHFLMPNFSSEEEYLRGDLSSFIVLHPALGPIWDIIAQKVRGGNIEKGSELQLEITDLDLENLQLNGSCQIIAENPLGHRDENGVYLYSDLSGKCELRNVKILNEGIEKRKENQYWKNYVFRKELFSLYLQGNSEFYAENITFKGNFRIIVPAGHRMIAEEIDQNICFRLEPIDRPSWGWKYFVQNDKSIQLLKSRS